MKNLYIFILISIVTFSCKKEKIITKVQDDSLHPNLFGLWKNNNSKESLKYIKINEDHTINEFYSYTGPYNTVEIEASYLNTKNISLSKFGLGNYQIKNDTLFIDFLKSELNFSKSANDVSINQWINPKELLNEFTIQPITNNSFDFSIHNNKAYFMNEKEITTIDLQTKLTSKTLIEYCCGSNVIHVDQTGAYFYDDNSNKIIQYNLEKNEIIKESNTINASFVQGITVINYNVYLSSYNKLFLWDIYKDSIKEINLENIFPTGLQALGKDLYVVNEEGIFILDISNVEYSYQIYPTPLLNSYLIGLAHDGTHFWTVRKKKSTEEISICSINN